MTFLFVLALIIWIFKPSWLMLLWIISAPILAPIMVLRSGIIDTEDLYGFLFAIWGDFQRVFLVIVFYQLIFKHKSLPKGISSFLIPCGLLCVYLLFHNGITHFDVASLFQNIKGTCYYFLPIFVMLLDKKVRPNLKAVFGVFALIVAVQIVMVPFNLKGTIVYTVLYQDKWFLQNEFGLVSGTFAKSNYLADFLSIMFLFICVDFFFRKSMSKIVFCTASVVLLILMALTGSKLPLVCSLLSFFMCIFFFKRHMILPILRVIAIFVLLLALSWSSLEKLRAEYRGVNRFVSGITAFLESKNGNNYSGTTLDFSTALIDHYFLESPIIGCGYAYKGNDKAYPLSINSDIGISNYEADATLAFYIVEYGLVGFFLFLWYFYVLIKYSICRVYSRNARIVAIIIFTFFLVFSITETGLFYRPNFFYIYLYVFGVQRWNEEQLHLSCAVNEKS